MREGEPLLAVDDPVWVEHGDDLEEEAGAQALCQGGAARQELQRALHHPAGIGLARVHPPRQEHHRPTPCTHSAEM